MKIALLVLTSLLFTSCFIAIPIDDYESIMTEVFEEIEYESTADWQTYKLTTSLGTGDCEDFDILMLKRVFMRYGVKGFLVILEHQEVDNYHSVVLLDKFYDPQINHSSEWIPYGYAIIEVMGYDEVMLRALVH